MPLLSFTMMSTRRDSRACASMSNCSRVCTVVAR
ncbi:Uncharacterised protein [Bordetella pertussis]|nr:Uncharacterised protein [Bordetella pertussis]CFP69289.1 Uncharacterised protein [Bordetella pertussis]